MKNIFLKYKYQVVLILIGIVWIVFLCNLFQIDSQNIFYSDSDNYRESASFLYHNFKSHYFRPMGMALLTGIPYFFEGNDASVYKFSFYLNVFCWLASGLLLFSLLKNLLSNNKAFLFTLIFYSLLGITFINFNLLTENIFIFFILMSFWFFDKYYKNHNFLYLSIAISILLFTMLIKPSTKFFGIIILFFYFQNLMKNFKNRNSIFIYLSLTFIVFQCFKVKNDYGNFTLTYIDSTTYYNYIGSKAMCFKTNSTFSQSNNPRANYLEKLSFPEQKIVAANDFINQMETNKSNLFKAYFSNLFDNTKSPCGFIEDLKNVNNSNYFAPIQDILIVISKYQNRIFTILGFVLALFYFFKSYKNEMLYSLISFYILYTFLISGISSSQGDRFHIVFFPMVILLVAKWYSDKYGKKNITT